MQRWRKNSDLIAALVVLFSSSYLAVLAYATVMEGKRPHDLLATGLSSGKHTYYVLAKGTCVGKYDVIVAEQQKIIQLIVQGELAGTYRDSQIAPKIKLELYFNPLGQLSEGDFTLDSPGIGLRLSSQGVNPLVVSYWLKPKSSTPSGRLEVEGPILIKQQADDTYNIRWSQLNEIQRNFYVFSPALFTKPLDLEVVSDHSEAVSKECRNGHLNPVNLAPLVDTLNSVVVGITGIINTFRNTPTQHPERT